MASQGYHRRAAFRSKTVLSAPLLLLFAGGCGPECDTLWYADADGDSYGDRDVSLASCAQPEAYVPDASDCNDLNAAIHPGQPEVCNDLDDNCDEVVDPDAQTWFVDADGDGWGDANETVTACFQPDGTVDRAGDCDDGEASAHPGQVPELCDGIDQDCDNLVDEGAPGPITWYPDRDGDGFGAEDEGEDLCSPPAGWTVIGFDCDDGSAFVNPTSFELCNGDDEDCDGLVDLDDPGGVVNAILVYVDADGDGFGAGVGEVACSFGPGQVTAGGDCDDANAAISPFDVEVCNGADDDCDGATDSADPSLDLATAVSIWADADGDGYGDPLTRVAVCAIEPGSAANDDDCDDADPGVGPDLWVPDGDGDGFGAGATVAGSFCAAPSAGYVNLLSAGDCDDGDGGVWPGALDACGDGVDADCTSVDPACQVAFDGVEALEDRGRAWADGDTAGDGFGAVGGGGDLDGDGLEDVLVGSPDGAGLVYAYTGAPPEFGPWAPAREWASGVAGRFGAAALLVPAEAGASAHLLVGAPDYNVTAGRVYVYQHGSDAVTTEITGFGALGSTLATVTGGAAPKVAIGAPDGSAVYVLSPNFAAAAQSAAGSALSLFGTAGSGFGGALASDGSTLAIAEATGPDGGHVWLVDASLTASAVVGAVSDGKFLAEGTTDTLGAAVAAGADFDGDGSPDFAASAPGNDASAPDAGAVYVWTSAATGAASDLAALEVRGAGADARIGQSLALADLDHDGLAELVIGATDMDTGGTDSGAVIVFSGGVAGVWDALSADAVLYGPTGGQAGGSLVAGAFDPDPGADLWVGVPGTLFGAAWLVSGPSP